MATNEIEILVKAEVAKAVANLKAVNTETDKLAKTGQKSKESAEQQGNALQGLAGKAGKVVAVLAGLVAGFIAAVKIGEKFADIAAEQTAVLSKLAAIAKNAGVSFTALNQAAEQLSSDGLISFNDAADSLANLLSKGMNLDQAIKLINTFKDSASVARPAHLGLGEAVRLTTEGIKNENSVLTDSSGIQKNYAAILADGARAQGLKVESLTDAQKSQILYNGFLKEGSVFEGKAAEASNTYAGAKARAEAATKGLAIAIGTFLTPIMKRWQELVAEVANGLSDLFGPKTTSEADKLQFQIKQNEKVIERFKQKIAENNKEMGEQLRYMKDVEEESKTWTKANADNQKVIDELTEKNKQLSKSIQEIIDKEKAAAEEQRKKKEKEAAEAEAAKKRLEKEKELQETLKSIRDKGGDAEIAKINELLKIKGLSAQDEITLNQRKNDILREQSERLAEEQKKIEQEKLAQAKAVVDFALSSAGSLIDIAGQVSQRVIDTSNAAQDQLLALDEERRKAIQIRDEEDYQTSLEDLQAQLAQETDSVKKEAIQRRIDRLIADHEYAQKRIKIEEEAQKKDAEIKRKGWLINKAFQIAAASINAIQATLAAFTGTIGIPVVGPVLAPIAAAAAGVFGASQVALIASEPVPEFAEGGLVTGPFPAMVGHGTEAILPAELTSLLLDAAGAGGSSTTNNDNKHVTYVANGITDPVAFINRVQRINGDQAFGGAR